MIVYEDEKAEVDLVENPLVPGQLRVIPKEKYATVQEIPGDLIAHFYFVASFAATTLFEGLGAEATNIIMNEGKSSPIKTVSIDVIPRKTDDGVEFKWDPQKITPEEMEEIKKKIAWEFIPPEQRAKRPEPAQPKQDQAPPEAGKKISQPPQKKSSIDEEDMLLKWYQKTP
jgi:diadenosine tetraphosphate (Ap4A) HIT family hydrolase